MLLNFVVRILVGGFPGLRFNNSCQGITGIRARWYDLGISELEVPWRTK